MNFSQPVKFEQVDFYEGDIVWQQINAYYRDDFAIGGFFEHLTVEILRDGKFIEPANLQITPPLDRFEMYQIITLSFAPTVGQAIRIIGKPGGTQGFTTILELEAQGDIDPGLYVASAKIAGGQAQRSTVDKIEVQFSRDVTVTKDDIELRAATNGTIDMNEVELVYDSATYWLTLSLPLALPDDAYDLRFDCAAITDANGLPLLDDDENPDDGFYTIQFHQLFADADGSATVDLRDLSLLALYWFDVPNDTGLDSNQDDILDFLDLPAFVENWLADF